MYTDYSSLIHHTDPLGTDSYNFRELVNYDETLISEIKTTISIIIEIYLEEFVLKVLHTDQLDLATKLNLNENLTNDTLSKLRTIV